MPKTRAMIKKTIRQKRDLISPFPKTITASSAKGLRMDKSPSPPRDTLMMKVRLSFLQFEDLVRNAKTGVLWTQAVSQQNIFFWWEIDKQINK